MQKSTFFQLLVMICLLVIGISCKKDNTKVASVTIGETNASGLTGSVTFSETDGVVTMTAEISGVAQGNHAIHIHETGDCSAADGTSAGGHWNPTGVDHGVWGTDPFHRGDIGNIEVSASGSGSISRQTDLWCVGCSDDSKNVVGKAIIVHAGPDDFSSQPSGAAGSRIGCGVIVEE